MNPTATWQAILDCAAAVWAGENRTFRDGMIECGLLLHEYVLTRLKSVDGLSDHARYMARVSRATCVAEAAARIGEPPARVALLIHVATAAELLSGGNPDTCGGMTYGCLRTLARFVRRPPGRTHVSGGTDRLLPSQRETWELVPETATRARALFARAAAEGWSGERANAEVRVVKVTKRVRRAAMLSLDSEAKVPLPVPLAKDADPRDVADMVLSLIAKSRDPARTARLVESGLRAHA